jgi:hypothetical protein
MAEQNCQAAIFEVISLQVAAILTQPDPVTAIVSILVCRMAACPFRYTRQAACPNRQSEPRQ